jgi:hypothetical protein
MSDQTTHPAFVTVKPGGQTKPKSITGLLPLQAYLVQYRDAENRENVRVVFDIEGTEEVLILAERTHGDALTIHGRKWFAKLFKETIGKENENDPVESV